MTEVLLGLGGMLLLSVFSPPEAVVLVHGVVQFASNVSRGTFAPKDIRRDIESVLTMDDLAGE